jgi:hypothetical protein
MKKKLKLRRETIANLDDISQVAGAGTGQSDCIQCSLLTCGGCPTAGCTNPCRTVRCTRPGGGPCLP